MTFEYPFFAVVCPLEIEYSFADSTGCMYIHSAIRESSVGEERAWGNLGKALMMFSRFSIRFCSLVQAKTGGDQS